PVADASEAENQHRPSRGFRHRTYRPEQSISLTSHSIGEEESIRISVAFPRTEDKRPESARTSGACVDRDRTFESAGHWVKDIDLAGYKTEITDPRVAAELTEARGSKSDPPGRCKSTAGNQPLQKDSV